MANPFGGDLVPAPELAVQIGEMLCEVLYGDLAQQKPFFAIDKGAYWRVEGSRNRDGAINGLAEFFLSIEKSNAHITDVGEYMRCPATPFVTQMINGQSARREKIKLSEDSGVELDATRGIDDDADGAERSRGMLLLTSMARGGIVFSGDLAVKIGELFCQAHFGDLSRQTPLAAVDKKEYWRVEGSWNKDGKAEGSGPFFVSIQKYDCQVSEIGE